MDKGLWIWTRFILMINFVYLLGRFLLKPTIFDLTTLAWLVYFNVVTIFALVGAMRYIVLSYYDYLGDLLVINLIFQIIAIFIDKVYLLYLLLVIGFASYIYFKMAISNDPETEKRRLCVRKKYSRTKRALGLA